MKRVVSGVRPRAPASLLAVCLLLAGCQGLPGACRLRREAAIPLHPAAGYQHVLGSLNGHALDLLLDTGAQSTILSSDAARRMDLHAEPSGAEETGIGGARSLSVLRVSDVMVGPLHGHELRLTSQEFGTRENPFIADGLLGDDILARYDIDLDIEAHTATLYAHTGDCATPTVTLPGSLFAVPLVPAQDPDDIRPMVDVTVHGHVLRALLDTGSPRTTLFRSAARRIGLRAADLAHDGQLLVGGSGPHREHAWLHVLDAIGVGGLTLSNARIVVVDGMIDGGIDMLLGVDFLARVHPWLSFSSRTLVIQYPPASRGRV